MTKQESECLPHGPSRPIQIYLDSDDYSKLTDTKLKMSEDDIATLSWMRQALADREIEVRYSIVHVIEACHREITSKQMALERATLMKDLSGSRVLLPFTEVIAREQVSGSTVLCARDNDGHWYPTIDIGGKMRADVRSLVEKEFTRLNANRGMRRAAKGILAKKSRRRKFVASVLQDGSGLESLCAVYGVPHRLAHSNIFKLMLDESVSEADFRECFLAEIFDVTHFVEDYIDRFEGNRIIRNAAHRLGSELIACVVALREALVDIRKRDIKVAQGAIDTAKATWRSQFEQFQQKIVERVREGRGGSDQNCPVPIERSISVHPGLEVVANVLATWLSDAIGSGKAPGRVPRTSDAGDVLHAFYAPYVDIWRGDRYVSAILRPALGLNRTIVVRRFVDIPKAYLEARARMMSGN